MFSTIQSHLGSKQTLKISISKRQQVPKKSIHAGYVLFFSFWAKRACGLLLSPHFFPMQRITVKDKTLSTSGKEL